MEVVQVLDDGSAVAGRLVLRSVQVLLGVLRLELCSQEWDVHVLRERVAAQDDLFFDGKRCVLPRGLGVGACDVSEAQIWLGR